MAHTTIKINWRGPFNVEDIDELDGGNGLYMFTGKRKSQRTESEIQYFGITERTYKDRFRNHHKLSKINRDLNIWIGEVVYPKNHTRQHLETAETVMIYFWQTQLNDRKKLSLPNSTTVISHWFNKEGQPRVNQKSIYKDLPDVISWDGKLWRTGNLSVYQD